MTDKPIHIVVENHIPFIRGVFERLGCEVSYLAAGDIDRQALMNADALVTRTRTRCDATLLEGTGVSLVATATIGTDHIDLKWCAEHGIAVANAPGCNAPAVAQYVLSSIARLTNRPVSQLRLGIVGAGHVGSIVERWARALDMEVMVCDPPRERLEGGSGWSSLENIAREADIVSVHTPLTREGEDATLGLIGEAFFAQTRRAPVVINAARGGIVDEKALLAAMESGRCGGAVTDCWSGEPEIDRSLLEKALIATPHIAGYSRQGKIRATAMAIDAVCRHFGLEAATPDAEAVEPCAQTVTVRSAMDSYNPLEDTAALREAFAREGGRGFERLRDSYALRPEAPQARID